MPLQTSGAISLNDIATEFGGTVPHSLSEYYAGGGLVPAGTSGTNGAVPSSGAISLSNFYGTSNIVEYAVLRLTKSPYLAAYRWSSAGWGTKFADPPNYNTNLIFVGNFDWGLAVSPSSTKIAVAEDSQPRLSIFPFSSSGWGSRLTNPTYATLPDYNSGAGARTCYYINFSPNEDAIAMVFNNSTEGPYNDIHVWSLNSNGIVSRYSSPTDYNDAFEFPKEIAWSPNNQYIAIANHYSAYLPNSTPVKPPVYIYPWSSSGGFGTKYANPSTWDVYYEAAIPTWLSHNALSVAFSQTSSAVVVGLQGAGTNVNSDYVFVQAWKWSSSGFGTKFSNPSITGFQGRIERVVFTQSNAAVAISGRVYAWSDNTGFGTVYSAPASGYPNGDNGVFGYNGVDFSKDNNAIMLSNNGNTASNPGVHVWPWSDAGGFGTKFANLNLGLASEFVQTVRARFGKV